MKHYHFRKKVFKQNLSLQFDKYAGDRYNFGLKFIYDLTVKSFAVHLSLGLYNVFLLAYKNICSEKTEAKRGK